MIDIFTKQYTYRYKQQFYIKFVYKYIPRKNEEGMQNVDVRMQYIHLHILYTNTKYPKEKPSGALKKNSSKIPSAIRENCVT